jgi:phosphoglycolate phosphatase
MNIPVPPAETLNAMIGPKLSDALLTHTDATLEQVPELISIYRAWYREHGIAMSSLYPGITDVLAALRADGVLLAVATQKPEPLAEIVLAHHGVAGAFDVICGSSADETLMPGDPGYRSGKTEIIAAAMAALGQDTALMVGDRHQDVAGATANGLRTVGVSWGFAADGELLDAGVSAVVETSDELLSELRIGLAQAGHERFAKAGSGERGTADGAL